MKFLRTLSRFLFIPPFVLLAYDLIDGWFIRAEIKVRSMQKFWMDASPSTYSSMRPFMEGLLTHKGAAKFYDLPAPVSMAALPIVLYIIYWISFKMMGGNSTGSFTYKSHD